MSELKQALGERFSVVVVVVVGRARSVATNQTRLRVMLVLVRPWEGHPLLEQLVRHQRHAELRRRAENPSRATLEEGPRALFTEDRGKRVADPMVRRFPRASFHLQSVLGEGGGVVVERGKRGEGVTSVMVQRTKGWRGQHEAHEEHDEEHDEKHDEERPLLRNAIEKPTWS